MDLYLERDVGLRKMVVILEKLDIVHLRQEEYEDLLLNQIRNLYLEIPGSIVYKSKLKRKAKNKPKDNQ